MKLSHHLLSVFLLTLVGVFAIKSVSFSETTSQKQNAGFSIKQIDTSVKPQDDFYRFASGNWLKKAVIPDNIAVAITLLTWITALSAVMTADK